MWTQMKVLRKYYRRVSCYWLEMECVMLWIMLCTTECDFVCHSFEGQTFNLPTKKKERCARSQNNWCWRLNAGKRKNVEKILYLKKKKIFFLFIKEKIFEKVVYLGKKDTWENFELENTKIWQQSWENFVLGKNCRNRKYGKKNSEKRLYRK